MKERDPWRRPRQTGVELASDMVLVDTGELRFRMEVVSGTLDSEDDPVVKVLSRSGGAPSLLERRDSGGLWRALELSGGIHRVLKASTNVGGRCGSIRPSAGPS